MPKNTAYSLLHDPLFYVKLKSDESTRFNLPQILEALIDDELVAFNALQPHQFQPLFSFLVQLAALAIARENDGQTPASQEEWRALLIKLAGGVPEAFCLVVHDLSKPAFLQTPIPEGSLKKAKYKNDKRSPDQLDILVTTRNHDLKRTRIRYATPEYWIYSLLTLQTLEGYFGVGNYGVVRMNGGYAARPMIGFSPSIELAGRFRRDLQMLLNSRNQTADTFGYDLQGQALLWLEPWGGSKKSGYRLPDLDPHFIEICRRIRFTDDDDHLICWRANTEGMRIEPDKKLKGITGDPWTPIERDGEKALNIVASGFPYSRVRDLLLDEKYIQPPALEIDHDADGGYFIAIGLARGEGKTDGFHRRILPVPTEIASAFLGLESRQILANRSKARMERAARVQAHVLRPALYKLVGEPSDFDDVRSWDTLFAANVDDNFFPMLWEDFHLDEEQADENWQRYLKNLAQSILEQAIGAASQSAARRYRIVAEAESIFINLAFKELPLAFSKTREDSTESQPTTEKSYDTAY